ncbi:MAG TPA: hypothetical protein VN931_12255 [Fibrobacteria bacterium]|nr:hypothetical protein [Fibrobacteria bacterium]
MKTRLIMSTAAVAVCVAGIAIAHSGEGPSPEQRKEFFEKKIAKLPPEEQQLARELQPLRDSLFRTIGQYKRKVHDGTAARSLTAERGAIQSLQARIYTLETQNPDVTLDLLADLPMPFMGREGHRGWGHHKGPMCDSLSKDGTHGPPAPGN